MGSPSESWTAHALGHVVFGKQKRVQYMPSCLRASGMWDCAYLDEYSKPGSSGGEVDPVESTRYRGCAFATDCVTVGDIVQQ